MTVFDLKNIRIGVDAYTAGEMFLEPRKREKMAVLRVFRQLTGTTLESFSHYDDGAPYVENSCVAVSISHCSTHVAVAVGEDHCSFGIDIERWREQLERIKGRFLSESSLKVWNIDNISLLRAWTLMEATYKAARIKGLDIRNNIEIYAGTDVCICDHEASSGKCMVINEGKSATYNFTSILIEPELIVSLVEK